MKEPLVYIIILNWNGYKDTIECLESLKKITYKNYKIVLIDNGSTDDSVKILHAKYPKIKLIENNVNLGFAGGCNIGIKYALKRNSDYVLLLNNDTIVESNFLNVLVTTSINDENIGIVGPIIYYYKKPRTIWASGAYKFDKYNLKYIDFNYGKRDSETLNEIKNVDFIWGCCLLIKKSLFINVGLFDDEYFMYTEDKDLSYRAQQAGYKLVINPKSKIWHKVSSSSGGENNNLIYYYMSRNNILFINKHFVGFIKLKYNFFYLFDILYRILYLIKRKKYNNIQLFILGTVHGFLHITGYYNFGTSKK